MINSISKRSAKRSTLIGMLDGLKPNSFYKIKGGIDVLHSMQPPCSTALSSAVSQIKGKTEIFNYGRLKLEITNVCEVKVDSMMNETGDSWECRVFVCSVGAKATVLNADMRDIGLRGSGKARAGWALLSAVEKRRDIIEGMKPFEIASDIIFLYNTESNIAVLEIEILADAI